ncbi:ABC transporter permease [Streptomyces specialis]|uniref:ABC transporter permease n=1 Tax=Streptomyces specialis TaxID=498367 RepID=UPI00073F38E9|nr:ABC transporter permease [Streptomyces specialis]
MGELSTPAESPATPRPPAAPEGGRRRPSRRSPLPAHLGLRPGRFRLRDLCTEAGRSVGGHPVRSLLTALGTVLGAAAFVATLGLSSTLSQQVTATFDIKRATEVTVLPGEDDGPEESPAGQSAAGGSPEWQSDAALDRLLPLAGVEAAGRRVLLEQQTLAAGTGRGAPALEGTVIGMDSAAFAAVEPRVTVGRTFDTYHDRAGAPVVLLPAGMAHTLGVVRPGGSVFINDRAFTVIGIFDDVARRPETLPAAVVPFSAAEPLAAAAQGPPATRDVVIRTAPGAAQLIGGQAPLALSPGEPEALRAVAPPDPRSMRREVEDSVTRMAVVLSAVSLAIGAVSIGNAATAGITARVSEIGLRRALGARRVHVFAQLMAETTLLGGAGGLLGAVAGIVVTVTVSLLNTWQPVLDVTGALAAAGGGVLAGLLAGLLPAVRAVRIEPVSALQR